MLTGARPRPPRLPDSPTRSQERSSRTLTPLLGHSDSLSLLDCCPSGRHTSLIIAPPCLLLTPAAPPHQEPCTSAARQVVVDGEGTPLQRDDGVSGGPSEQLTRGCTRRQGPIGLDHEHGAEHKEPKKPPVRARGRARQVRWARGREARRARLAEMARTWQRRQTTRSAACGSRRRAAGAWRPTSYGRPP